MRRFLYPAFAALAYAGSTCLNNGGADGSNICFTWAVDSAAGTITINAECTPPTFPPPVVGPVTWCAIGLNKGQTSKMFQSNIWVFGPTPGGPAGSAFVGDHLSIVRACCSAHPSLAAAALTVCAPPRPPFLPAGVRAAAMPAHPALQGGWRRWKWRQQRHQHHVYAPAHRAPARRVHHPRRGYPDYRRDVNVRHPRAREWAVLRCEAGLPAARRSVRDGADCDLSVRAGVL